ncbi:MAG: GatB/YqeY domain-containing protein [Cytophagales bacterium]|nr:MAG: GatB/YqeY domain-containing protein [Cytophagales bacterium]
MSLKQIIDADIKKAMLAQQKDELRALRGIKSMILLAETAEGASEAGLSKDAEIKLLSKAAKQRKDSAQVFASQGRIDLEQNELVELAVIERYLPKQLSLEEIKAKLQEIIEKVGAKSPSDMGKVMGIATKELAGLADGKIISETVKALLG